jgi:putative transposase
VSEKAGRWFVSLQMEEEINVPEKPKRELGVDLGIKSLATCSDGMIFENPKALRSRLKKLQRLSRNVSRKVKGSQNRKKAHKRLAKLHYRIACIRSDTIHKLTSSLTKNKSRIVIEDLNVSGMMKNKRLSRAIADIGLFEVRRQLEYKGRWYGCEIDHADRFYPSSKRCSSCGFIKNDLQLSDRVYVCPVCGLEIDRDVNAAINLLNHRTASSAGNYAFGERSSGSTLSVG